MQLIAQPYFFPTVTYGHEVWVMTERTRSHIRVAVAEMCFRVAGIFPRERVRSSIIRKGLRVDPLLLKLERSQPGNAWGVGIPQ